MIFSDAVLDSELGKSMSKAQLQRNLGEGWLGCFPSNYYFYPYPRICLLILERKGERDKERARETGREREKEKHYVREKHQSIALIHAPTSDQTCNLGILGMCPDWELNPQCFGVCDEVPTD